MWEKIDWYEDHLVFFPSLLKNLNVCNLFNGKRAATL